MYSQKVAAFDENLFQKHSITSGFNTCYMKYVGNYRPDNLFRGIQCTKQWGRSGCLENCLRGHRALK